MRRTSKNYSRSAINLTLEQTVNHDAASPTRGLVHFYNNEDCICRWYDSSHQRGMVVGELKKMAMIEREEMACTQKSKSRIPKDNEPRALLNEALDRYCDPFSDSAIEVKTLLNLARGKEAATSTAVCLTNTHKTGLSLRLNFQEQYEKEPETFFFSNQTSSSSQLGP